MYLELVLIDVLFTFETVVLELVFLLFSVIFRDGRGIVDLVARVSGGGMMWIHHAM
jgi:hypothetical protein